MDVTANDMSNLFSSSFAPEHATPYLLSAAFAEAFPGKAIVEGFEEGLDLDELATSGLCEVSLRTSPHAKVDAVWRRAHGLGRHTKIAIWDVTWEGRRLVVGRATWREMFNDRVHHWVVADERTIAERFADAACAWCNQPRDALLVFRGGCWQKSHELAQQVEASSFDDLVLAGSLKEEIQEDFRSFLAAKPEYERFGVPWKRGVLFVGPPGNGKTHCLRATIKMLRVPCLYVQSLKSRYETDDANIAKVFDRAREVTPCCLVFEDLDAIVTPENRSAFLNELDGFASASGMLTLATTNHPEKLDPSILERPSRFDRKYNFGLPAATERQRYLAGWNARLDEALRVTDSELDGLAEDTDGFSFAYLKELYLSSMMRWMVKQERGAMLGVLRGQLAVLRAQMRS